MKDLQEGILRILIYFDIFSFPLRKEEILRYCPVRASEEEVKEALDGLADQGRLVRSGEFYFLEDDPGWIERRLRNQEISRGKIRQARRNAAFLSQFPFVRGIAISGSVSKYSADESADTDFFIITKAGRLWICRSLLHFFKKLTFLPGRQHEFCMNFFLDQREIELKDKNIYTALESVTIIPVYGAASHAAFLAGNSWIRDFFPNLEPALWEEHSMDERNTPVKRLLETLLAGRWGDFINGWLMRTTVRWWQFKFSRMGYPRSLFHRAMRSTPGESKNHPGDYQGIVLAAYQERLVRFGFGEEPVVSALFS